MRSRLAVLAALALLSLAGSGCSDDGGKSGAGNGSTSTDAAAGLQPSEDTYDFAIALGNGLPLLGDPLDTHARVSFEVPKGAKELTATTDWHCNVAIRCSMDVELRLGENDLVSAESGLPTRTITVEDPPAGHWTVWVYPSGSGELQLQVDGTVTISVS